jgi:ferric-dicitrate binding protein FerR (iron transport regulator)
MATECMKVGVSMESESQRNILDENLRRLLEAAREEDSGFQMRLLDAVREEVGNERSAIRKRWVIRSLSAATAAAAVLAIAWSLAGLQKTGDMGEFRPLYGAAEVTDSDGSRTLLTAEPIRAGCSIRTLSGSKAEILLRDGSRLTLAPRTTVQIADGKRGPAATLKTGTVDIEAARQHAGRKLVIATPGSRIVTLGTVFTVQLSTKPDGTRKTRVGVTSGLVEFESGGQKVRLPARTEGIAEEGQSPEKRLASFELNRLLQLIRRNSELAQRQNKREGSPAIVQFKDGSTASIWTVVSIKDLREMGAGRRTLRLKSPASRARLFTLDGREIPADAQGRDLRVDASELDSGDPQDARWILELCDVKGVFQTEDGDAIRLRIPFGTSDAITLIQFHLPDRANIEHVSPEPVEVTRMLDRLAVTVAAGIEGLEVIE